MNTQPKTEHEKQTEAAQIALIKANTARIIAQLKQQKQKGGK